MKQSIESIYYKKGLNDAWECVKKMVERKVDIEDVFGEISLLFLLRKYSAQEAMNKIREYEEKQKHGFCSIIEDDCPYEIECEDCEVFCSVERAKKRLGKK